MSLICVVLNLVDCFLSYPQQDKIAVFFSLSKILQFCFVSLSGLGDLVLGRSKPNRNKLMLWNDDSFYFRLPHDRQPFL